MKIVDSLLKEIQDGNFEQWQDPHIYTHAQKIQEDQKGYQKTSNQIAKEILKGKTIPKTGRFLTKSWIREVWESPELRKNFDFPEHPENPERNPAHREPQNRALRLALRSRAGILVGAHVSPGYLVQADTVLIPGPEKYLHRRDFCLTLLHELAHWTGHEDRLNRPGIGVSATSGSLLYYQEEITAELVTAVLAKRFGLGDPRLYTHQDYLGCMLLGLEEGPWSERKIQKSLENSREDAIWAIAFLGKINQRNLGNPCKRILS